jgi:1,4-dihydroxy-6-naphthoate synthase
LEDVEYLNKAALNGEIEVTKLSYFAFSKIIDNYQILNSGGALGKNCGPLIIRKNDHHDLNEDLKIAIPGLNTTANFLLSLAFPRLKNKTEVLFSKIEDSVLNQDFDLGLIIHESRFTYEAKGLTKVIDLGQYWEDATNSPIPLGGIAIRRNLDHDIKKAIDLIIHNSVAFAFNNPTTSQAFVKSHSQEMDDDVINAHINLYVNEFSLHLGDYGRKGVLTLFEKLKKNGFISDYNNDIFVD